MSAADDAQPPSAAPSATIPKIRMCDPQGIRYPSATCGRDQIGGARKQAPIWVLVSAIARGRRRLDDVVSGRVTTVAELRPREKCSVRQINMTISLAFLAPN